MLVQQHFVRIKKGSKECGEASSGQPPHVKKQRRIGLLIEPLPRQFAGHHDRGTM
jgi:hypothetical protein